MKTLMTVALIATTLAAPSAFAGRDGIDTMQQERANLAARQEQVRQAGPAAAGPAGDVRAAREGEPGKQRLKRLHPRNAYGF